MVEKARLSQDDASCAVERAQTAMRQRDWDEAVKLWEGILNDSGATEAPDALRQLHFALRWQGDHTAADEVFDRYLAYKESTDYPTWLAENDTLSDLDRSHIRGHIESLPELPKVSLLMVVGDASRGNVLRTIDSVRSQIYENWEFCIVDDASTSVQTRTALGQCVGDDVRIRVKRREERGGPSVGSQAALDMASGEWVGVIDCGDSLSEHGLYLVAHAITTNPKATVVYSDQDHIDEMGQRSDPYFKTAWDHEFFLTRNFLHRFTTFRADLARSVGGFRAEYGEAHEWDLGFRVVEADPSGDIVHLPFILYHILNEEASLNREGEATEAELRAVNDHLERAGQAATATRLDGPAHIRIKRDLPAARPLVSIVIPTKDQGDLLRTCIDGIANRTGYAPIEIVVVDNGTTETGARAFLDELQLREDVVIMEDPWDFNFSSLVNGGVAVSTGDVCVLLNNDIDVINPDWLEEMVSHALRPDVGVVGAKLYYANDTLQHGGVVLGMGGVAGHPHRRFPRTFTGYAGSLAVSRNVSAVTGACLAVRRDVYDEVGGFNEEMPMSFNDVDFCLRVREEGLKVIWTPYAELYHLESASRRHWATSKEKARARRARIEADRYMAERWGHLLHNDPYYNPNLDLHGESLARAKTTRARRPWLGVA